MKDAFQKSNLLIYREILFDSPKKDEPEVFRTEGDFRRKILIVLNKGARDEQTREMFHKILESVQLHPEDILIVEVPDTYNLGNLLKKYKPEKCISFGIIVHNPSIILNNRINKHIQFNDYDMVITYKLVELAHQPQAKKALWTALKSLMKING